MNQVNEEKNTQPNVEESPRPAPVNGSVFDNSPPAFNESESFKKWWDGQPRDYGVRQENARWIAWDVWQAVRKGVSK